jgi:glycosidase
MSNWIEKAAIYQIFIDRFAGCNPKLNWDVPEFMGGNLSGIVEKIPYIESLGVNTIWLSPFCKTSAYHGYHVTDFYAVDSHFGTEDDLKKLLAKARQNGIRMIVDFLPNHCSAQHPYFLDAIGNPDSRYHNWFIFDKWPDDYRCFLSYKELPKLNLDYQPAYEHILGSARKWLAMGFDGLRIDHIIGLSNGNVAKMFGQLKKEFPDAVFIGEATMSGIKWCELKTVNVPHKHLLLTLRHLGLRNLQDKIMYKNYVGILDGLLNFTAFRAFEKYANHTNERIATKVKKQLANQSAIFKNKLILPTFLDNHDEQRILWRCNNDKQKLMDITKLQFQLPNPVIIYYGTEVGMTQTEPFSVRQEHADILARQPMIWNQALQDAEILDYYRKLIRFRPIGLIGTKQKFVERNNDK